MPIPVINMVARRNGSTTELWALLHNSVIPGKSCLLMYSTDNGTTWNRFIEPNALLLGPGNVVFSTPTLSLTVVNKPGLYTVGVRDEKGCCSKGSIQATGTECR